MHLKMTQRVEQYSPTRGRGFLFANYNLLSGVSQTKISKKQDKICKKRKLAKKMVKK